MKKVLTSYYRWKVRRNENKLLLLKEKKEGILDQVMETETYKVAKDILETFAPEQIRKASLVSPNCVYLYYFTMQECEYLCIFINTVTSKLVLGLYS